MSNDTPTERFEPSESGGDEHEARRKFSPLVIILSIIGAIFLIVIVILATLLLSRDAGTSSGDNPTATVTPSASASQSPSATPSPTPSASPSSSPSSVPPEPPQATGPRFTMFDAPASQRCSAGGPGFPPTRPSFTVAWATAGADEAWFVNGTSDAKDSGYLQIPLNGSQGDFAYEQTVDCGDSSNVYTITLVGPDGTHVSKTWTVEITGDNF